MMNLLKLSYLIEKLANEEYYYIIGNKILSHKYQYSPGDLMNLINRSVEIFSKDNTNLDDSTFISEVSKYILLKLTDVFGFNLIADPYKEEDLTGYKIECRLPTHIILAIILYARGIIV